MGSKTHKKVIAVTFSPEESVWKSCQDLARNLRSAYEIAFGSRIELVPSLNPGNYRELKRTARELIKINPHSIAFTEPGPTPGDIFKVYSELRNEKGLTTPPPKSFFHLYGGGLSLDMLFWKRAEPILRKSICHFTFASERQHALMAPLFQNPAQNTSVCPFPISPTSYFFSPELRHKFRATYGFTEKDKLFVYTGRLSSTKNILALIKTFASYAANNPYAHLFLAGPFDDVSLSVFTYLEKRGEYGRRCRELLSQIDPSLRHRIRHLGVLSSEQILELNNGADAYISLATFHNEDFGLAPLEALCCGSPVILANWGGFSQYGGNSRDCILTSVRFTSEGLAFRTSEIHRAFDRICENDSSDEVRERRSRRFLKRYSPETIAEQLIDLHSSPVRFKGFSKASEIFMKGPNLAFPMGFLGNEKYREMYQRYLPPHLSGINRKMKDDLYLRQDWIGETIRLRSSSHFFKEIRDRFTHCFDERQ